MKLFIPLICYNHTMNTEYSMSVMNLVMYLKDNGIVATIYPITFDSLISRARNAAAAFFMEDKQSTHLLFIDSDIEFKPEDVLKLINAEKEVVCAGYAQKWLDEETIKKAILNKVDNVFDIGTKGSVHLENPIYKVEDLMKCEYVTTGFLLIKKSAFEKIIEEYPDNYYINDVDAYSSIKTKFYDFFPIGINKETRRYESEDYGFSRLYKNISYENKLWCHTNIVLKHHGWYGYKNNLNKQLKLLSNGTI